MSSLYAASAIMPQTAKMPDAGHAGSGMTMK
jgi:hypothetical protein